MIYTHICTCAHTHAHIVWRTERSHGLTAGQQSDASGLVSCLLPTHTDILSDTVTGPEAVPGPSHITPLHHSLFAGNMLTLLETWFPHQFPKNGVYVHQAAFMLRACSLG